MEARKARGIGSLQQRGGEKCGQLASRRQLRKSHREIGRKVSKAIDMRAALARPWLAGSESPVGLEAYRVSLTGDPKRQASLEVEGEAAPKVPALELNWIGMVNLAVELFFCKRRKNA